MAVIPYHLKLKKVSAKQQRLLDALYEYLPATGVRDRVGPAIIESIARHVGDELSFRLEAVHQEDYASFLSKLADPALVVVFGMAPVNRKALCDIDLPLARLMIDRMLGGQSRSVPEVRSLSDTEEGVLQYLVLQVLSHVHRMCDKDARVHFRFDKFAFQAHQARDLAKSDDGVAVLVFRVAVGHHSGFVRLVFPDPFVEEAFLSTVAPGETRRKELAYRQGQFSRFDFVKVPLWAEVGRSSLTPADLRQLEEGDVILFDHSDVSIASGEPHGRAMLRMGSGLHGGFDIDFSVDDRRVHCKITGINKQHIVDSK